MEFELTLEPKRTVFVMLSHHAKIRGIQRDVLNTTVPIIMNDAKDKLKEILIKKYFVIIDTTLNITVVGIFVSKDEIVIVSVVNKGKEFKPKENDIVIYI